MQQHLKIKKKQLPTATKKKRNIKRKNFLHTVKQYFTRVFINLTKSTYCFKQKLYLTFQ